MKQNEAIERREQGLEKHECNGIVSPAALKVVGGLALLGVAALVVVALPDIKRYIKISSM